ncbi:MAG: hypothetical protein ACEY3F_08950, partial [Wolbachia sp.]
PFFVTYITWIHFYLLFFTYLIIFSFSFLFKTGSKKQAEFMKVMIEERLAEYKLKLHPEKTQIVYCKDDDRREEFPTQNFDFLGYTFRPRVAKNKMRNYFVSFLPAICNKAKKKIKKTIKSWRIHRITWTTLEEISKKIDPIVRGWLWQVL